MEDMYGRANPKPEPPKFDAEDMKNMREAEETRLLKTRETSKNELYWQEIEVEKCLGLETETIKWKQNQTYVEIFVRLDGYAGGMSAHESAKSEDVQVDMSRSRLSVRYKDDVIIDDKKLYKDIKVELSTWVIVDNVTKTDGDYFIAGVNAILSAAFSVSKILLLHAKITKARQHLISVSVLCNVLTSLCSFLQSFSSSPLARLRLTYANFQCVSTCNPIALLPVLTRPV